MRNKLKLLFFIKIEKEAIACVLLRFETAGIWSRCVQPLLIFDNCVSNNWYTEGGRKACLNDKCDIPVNV